MSVCQLSRRLPRPFRFMSASFPQRPDLPFADVITERSIQRACEHEGTCFADGQDAVYTPAIALWERKRRQGEMC